MADPVADVINEMIPEDGPFVPTGEPPEPTTPSGEPLTPADQPAEDSPAPEPAPSEETPSEAAPEETLDLEAFVGKLSPEQKAALLKRFDTDELFRLDERLSGRLGSLAQEQAKKLIEAANKTSADAAASNARAEALRDRDPDKALEVLQQQATGDDRAQHEAAFQNAISVFTKLDADPVTKPLVAHLGGRDYGAMAGGDGTPENPGNGMFADLLFRADMANAVVDKLPEVLLAIKTQIDAAWEKKVKEEIEPAVERRVRAERTTADPGPITGSSTGAGGQSDTDFLLAYGRGETHDHRRARQLTGVT